MPGLIDNVLVDYAVLSALTTDSLADKIWLHLGLRYVGEQFSRWGKSLTDPRETVDSYVLFNLGLTADEIIGQLSLGIQVYNVADQKYYQGGSVDYPYLQPGRWMLGTVSYKF